MLWWCFRTIPCNVVDLDFDWFFLCETECCRATICENHSGPFAASPVSQAIVVLSALCFCVKNITDSHSALGSYRYQLA